MKHWCNAMGLTWGQGIGIWAGEMLPFVKNIPLGHGPNKNIGRAFKELACNITALDGGKDLFISPNWSRFLWKIQASFSFFILKPKRMVWKRRICLNRYRMSIFIIGEKVKCVKLNGYILLFMAVKPMIDSDKIRFWRIIRYTVPNVNMKLWLKSKIYK